MFLAKGVVINPKFIEIAALIFLVGPFQLALFYDSVSLLP